MRFFSPLAASLLFLLALPVAAPVQAQAPIRVDVNLVLVEATVKDKAGHIMDGLKQEDFVLTDSGAPQQIAHFSRDQLPLAVALVVDLSESIRPFLRPLRYATQTALKALKPEDEVALFTFSSSVERLVSLTKDKTEVAGQIQDFSVGGATNINQAVFDAADYLRNAAPAARRVIVLVSDNVPTTRSGEGAKDVTDAALEADAAVYSLKVPGSNPLAARLAAHAAGMVNVGKLVADTGGEIFDVEKEGSLFLAFQALIERLKTRYTLGFYPAQKSEDGRFHKLELVLQPSFGKKGREYQVVAKKGYYALRPHPAD